MDKQSKSKTIRLLVLHQTNTKDKNVLYLVEEVVDILI